MIDKLLCKILTHSYVKVQCVEFTKPVNMPLGKKGDVTKVLKYKCENCSKNKYVGVERVFESDPRNVCQYEIEYGKLFAQQRLNYNNE